MLMHPSENTDRQLQPESTSSSPSSNISGTVSGETSPPPLSLVPTANESKSDKIVDFCYRRSFCAMCNRALRYLKARMIPVRETVVAERQKLGPDDALAMARRASHIWVTRGEKLHHFDMKAESPTDSELLRVMLAPSGNLRAPTLVFGEHLIVGFDEDAYRQLFDK